MWPVASMGQSGRRAFGLNQAGDLLRVELALFGPRERLGILFGDRLLDQLRPHSASLAHHPNRRIWKAFPSGRRTSKFPHFGTASCWMIRTLILQPNSKAPGSIIPEARLDPLFYGVFCSLKRCGW